MHLDKPKVTANVVKPTEGAEAIVNSIQPDSKDSHRFKINIDSEDDKVIIEVEADDVSAAQAALNSYLRLVRSTLEL